MSKDQDSEYNEKSSELEELRDEINNFLKRNFPQIQMHGGSSAIVDLDPEESYVSIQLGGACSGCGISPMTTQAIRRRLPNQIDEIDEVKVHTGDEGMGGMGFPDPSQREDDEKNGNLPDAPF